jgi:hypothetical protein
VVFAKSIVIHTENLDFITQHNLTSIKILNSAPDWRWPFHKWHFGGFEILEKIFFTQFFYTYSRQMQCCSENLQIFERYYKVYVVISATVLFINFKNAC